MGPTPRPNIVYRVKTNMGGFSARERDFEDYHMAREHYASMYNSAGTGDTVEFYEVRTGSEERYSFINTSLDAPQPSLQAKPVVDDLALQRGHKCHWGSNGSCIRCRKPRPHWR